MAFTSYIILDGYRYKTLAKQWRPSTARPATARLTLVGDFEATFGVGTIKRWEGMVSIKHGTNIPLPADGTLEGNISTMRATLLKLSTVSFTDHNGTAYPSSVLLGPFEEQTLVNVWDSVANRYYVRVQIATKG